MKGILEKMQPPPGKMRKKGKIQKKRRGKIKEKKSQRRIYYVNSKGAKKLKLPYACIAGGGENGGGDMFFWLIFRPLSLC